VSSNLKNKYLEPICVQAIKPYKTNAISIFPKTDDLILDDETDYP